MLGKQFVETGTCKQSESADIETRKGCPPEPIERTQSSADANVVGTERPKQILPQVHERRSSKTHRTRH